VLRRGEMVEVALKPEVLPPGEGVVHGQILGDVADLAADGKGVDGGVQPHHPHGTAGGTEEGGEHHDGGRLAGAVGPEEAEDLPLLHLEGEAPHRFHAAGVGLAQLFHVNDGCHSSSLTLDGSGRRDSAPRYPSRQEGSLGRIGRLDGVAGEGGASARAKPPGASRDGAPAPAVPPIRDEGPPLGLRNTWWAASESNPGPWDQKSPALPTELAAHTYLTAQRSLC